MITKEQVYEALHECYDPEIPVNIVDLGLVYDVQVNDDNVAVKMTLTAPGCFRCAPEDSRLGGRRRCHRRSGLGSALGSKQDQ
jgi:hypothetical protein